MIKKHLAIIESRKQSARKGTKIDAQAVEAMKFRIQNLENIDGTGPEGGPGGGVRIPPSDEEVGVTELIQIMPDTWNNISWVIQSSIDLLKQQVITNSRQLFNLRKYSIEQHFMTCRDEMERLLKGNEDLLKFEKLVEIAVSKMEHKVHRLEDETSNNFLDNDIKMDKVKTLAEENHSEILKRLSKIKEADVMEQYTRDKVKEAFDEVSARIKRLEKVVNNDVKAEIRDIYEVHLHKKNLIGTGENCKAKSLMEYTIGKTDQQSKDIFKMKSDIGKMQFSISSVNDNLKAQLENKLPYQLK